MKADNFVEWLKQWKQDRDAAIRSLDVETFKRFFGYINLSVFRGKS